MKYIFVYNLLQTQQPEEPQRPDDCPLDKSELGRSTWGFLHSMASYYPVKPTCQQADDMTKFFDIFAQFYPCEPCAIDFKKEWVFVFKSVLSLLVTG